MPSSTPNLGLVKPAGADLADIAVINSNMDILDAAVTLTGNQTLTNKTLTSPTINGATFGSGITVTGASSLNGTLGGVTTLTCTTVAATNLGGTITTAAQPNITSVGTLTTLAVTNAITAGTGVTITTGGLTVTAGGANITGAITGTGTGGFGAWTDFTPTMTQSGAVTLTVNNARYAILGKIAMVEILVTPTSAGSAGSPVILATIPAAIAPRLTGANSCVGSFMYGDTGTAFYVGIVNAVSSSTFNFFVHNGTAALGTAPSFATANNDTLSMTCLYEIA